MEQSDWAPLLAAAGTSLVLLYIGITPDPSSSPVINKLNVPSPVNQATCIQFDSQERREKYQYTILLYYVYTCVAARIVSHTTDTDTDTKLTNYLGSVQTNFTWHDGRYARAQMDRGGADARTFGRGGAESTTFDLPTADTKRSHSMSPTTLKCSAKGKRLKETYMSASGAIWGYIHPCNQ